MKKLLQKLDSTAAKPVEGSGYMKKFVSIISEATSPHKVTLPVQMAMNHYSKPVSLNPVVSKTSILKKYFVEAEDDIAKEKHEKRAIMNQYASYIAERVRLKETRVDELSPATLASYKKKAGAESSVADKTGDYEKGHKRFKGVVKATKKEFNQPVKEEFNAPDTVTVDIPLLIRLFEYAREDAKSDMDLHNVTEKLIAMSENSRTLTMRDYEEIVNISNNTDQ